MAPRQFHASTARRSRRRTSCAAPPSISTPVPKGAGTRPATSLPLAGSATLGVTSGNDHFRPKSIVSMCNSGWRQEDGRWRQLPHGLQGHSAAVERPVEEEKLPPSRTVPGTVRAVAIKLAEGVGPVRACRSSPGDLKAKIRRLSRQFPKPDSRCDTETVTKGSEQTSKSGLGPFC